MDFRALFLGLSFALMWSSAFTSARIIVMHAPPLAASAVRFAIAGCLTLVLAWALKQSFRLTRAQWRSVVIFGLCQNALYLGLFFVAMQRIEAGFAAILASSMPLLVALANAVMGERIGVQGALGLVLGFAGVIFIMVFRLQAGVDLIGIVLCMIGVIALSIATLSVKSASSGGNIFTVVGFQMLVGSAALFPVSLLLETWAVTITPLFVAAFAYTIIVPGIIATLVWFFLVGRIGAIKAATFHFLNPFFGVAIAAIILSENLTLRDIAGVAVIMTGILLVQTSRAKA